MVLPVETRRDELDQNFRTIVRVDRKNNDEFSFAAIAVRP